MSRYLFLEIDDLLDPEVDELVLRLCQSLPLLGGLVKECRVDLSLFVFEGHVAGEDVAVVGSLLHVRVAGSVVEDEALDQDRVEVLPVLHRHDLHHVQVNVFLAGLSDAVHRVHADLGQQVGGLNDKQKIKITPCAF